MGMASWILINGKIGLVSPRPDVSIQGILVWWRTWSGGLGVMVPLSLYTTLLPENVLLAGPHGTGKETTPPTPSTPAKTCGSMGNLFRGCPYIIWPILTFFGWYRRARPICVTQISSNSLHIHCNFVILLVRPNSARCSANLTWWKATTIRWLTLSPIPLQFTAPV